MEDNRFSVPVTLIFSAKSLLSSQNSISEFAAQCITTLGFTKSIAFFYVLFIY